MNLENGKTIRITAPANNAVNKYVNKLNYDGKVYEKNWFSHSELMKGAVINIEMTAKPNQNRGTKNSDVPFSLSEKQDQAK